jgi:hypothetical protein
MAINFQAMSKKQKNRFFLHSLAWKTGSLIGGTGIPEKEFNKAEIFLKEFVNFRRLDNMSKAACSAIALLLKALKLYPTDKKLAIPIFFSNPNGTLFSDSKYFVDFLEFGEVSGRANLFLYTLPTSPLGEASVHFGLTGNMSYVNSLTPLKSICDIVMNSADDYKEGVLIGIGESNPNNAKVVFIYLNKDESSGKSLEEISQLEYRTVLELKESLLKLVS